MWKANDISGLRQNFFCCYYSSCAAMENDMFLRDKYEAQERALRWALELVGPEIAEAMKKHNDINGRARARG
jgi:hypothetical protein